jgi:hypothetical protein
MDETSVELLAREGNLAVLRLPGRKFPGLFVQGDTLATIVSLLEVEEGNGDADAVSEARERLTELLAFYEAALAENGIQRPY